LSCRTERSEDKNRLHKGRDRDPTLRQTLLTPLKEGEDPASKLATLRQALGAETDRQALEEWAIAELQGFRPPQPDRKRQERGASRLTNRILEANGYPTTYIPRWVDRAIKRRICRAIDQIRNNAEKRLFVMQCVQEVLKRETIAGSSNPYLIKNPRRRKQFAQSIREVYYDQKKFNKETDTAYNEQAMLDCILFYKDHISGNTIENIWMNSRKYLRGSKQICRTLAMLI
jgi:hypothetical protein